VVVNTVLDSPVGEVVMSWVVLLDHDTELLILDNGMDVDTPVDCEVRVDCDVAGGLVGQVFPAMIRVPLKQ